LQEFREARTFSALRQRHVDAMGALKMISPTVREVLNHWPQSAGEAQVCSATPGFSGARVFRITADGATWCLRRWPDGTSGLPAARIRELHRWLAFLKSEGVTTVAVPVLSRNSSTLVVVDGSTWHLEPWLPGTADFCRDPSDVRLLSAVAALAKLHVAAERHVPSPEGAAWFASRSGVAPAVSERRDRLLRWTMPHRGEMVMHGSQAQRDLAGELATSLSLLAPRIAVELEQCAAINVRLHPCLRDVWHDHILFTGDAVTGIIDPSAARTENVASDLSRLLGSLIGDAGDRWETALDAYSAVRPLSAEERRLIPVLDRSGVVLSVGHWLERMTSGELNAREWERVRLLSQRVFAMR
jgi:Ser/Thr protein kinase RdoA (MazF antagonist)